jgi:PAS domain S-box-containing protein
MNSLLTEILSLRSLEHLIVDEDFKIVELSTQVHHLSEIPEDLTLGQDVRLGFPELFGIEEVFEGIRQGEQNNFELKGIVRYPEDSSPIYINICVTKNLEDAYATNRIMILVEDVTERMMLEQSLVQGANEANLLLRTLTASKQYIDQIVTSMADALLVTTLSGQIKRMNPAAQALFEYNEAELRGQPISIIIGEVDSWKSETGEKEIEIDCQTKSGKTIPVAFSFSIVQTEVEHFQGYVYIIRDMTERKQAELAKQEFLAMISHEVRTPITSVTGMANLLLDTDLTDIQRDFVQIIDTSGNALLKIVNDFLDFSKIEAGKLELEEQPFNLQKCVYQAFDIVTSKAREKGLKLTFVDPLVSTTVLGDITRLRQVLVNLLSNAIKFTHTGSVEVSIKFSQSIDNNNEIQFAVKDTGIGIPRNRLDRLFKAFTQVNASITRQYGGTGLGLAICKQLCDLMGGRIWVESEANIGSIFYFTITAPIKEGVENGKVDVKEDTVIDFRISEQHPLKILLVEDHLINQRMIQLMLQGMGYAADVASNGLEALSALRHQPYDVVLMDVQMPEMDGLTASEHICQEWTLDTRPRIIALTASAMWGERDRCFASGMNDYLTKPIRIQELVQVLKKCQPIIKDKQMKELAKQEKIQNPIHSAALYEILQMASFNPSVDALEFLFEIIDYYLEETPRVLQDIHIYLDQANYTALRRATHTLSSTSATVGAVNLAKLCTELEIMMVNEESFGAAEKIYNIEIEYQQVEIALQNEREKYLN